MLARIRSWFTLPPYQNPAYARTAGMLRAILLTALFVSLLLGLIYDPFTLDLAPRWLLMFAFWAVALLSWSYLRRGRVRLATVIFLAAALLTITERAWLIYGGLSSPFTGIYPLLVILTGFLLGSLAGHLIALTSIFILLLMGLNGIVVPSLPDSGLNTNQLFTLWMVLVLFADIIQHLLAHSLAQADALVHSRQTELARYNQELITLQHDLEKLVRERTAEIESQKQVYQALVENNPLAIVSLDVNHAITACNPAFETLYLVSEADVKGRHLDDVIAKPEILAEARQLTNQVMGGDHIHSEGIRYRADGSPVPVEILGVPIFIGGQRKGVLGIYQDLTERKAAEKAQAVLHQRYRQAVDNSPNPIFTIDLNGLITTWNPACEAVFLFDQQMLGKSYLELLPKTADRQQMRQYVAEVFVGSTHSHIEVEFTCRDGRTRQMISRLFPVLDAEGRVEGAVFANTDITERERMAAELRRSESRLRSIIEQTQDGIAMMDDAGLVVEWNPALERITGLSRQQALGSPVWQVLAALSPSGFPPAQSVDIQQAWMDLSAESNPQWLSQPIEHTIVRPDGQAQVLQSVVFPIRTASSQMSGIFTRDVTDRVRAASRLQELYQTFAAVLDGLSVGVYVADLETCEVLLVNKYLENTFGPEIVGQHCHSVFFGRSTRCPNCNNQYLIDATGHLNRGLVWEEFVPAVKRWYMFSDQAIQWFDGRIVRLEMMVDITERKESEQRLHFLATHDTLTHLPNRAMFSDRLEHAVLNAQRSGGKVAVIFLDLDNFKHVNDTSGHDTGDRVLREVANRLRSALRAVDTVARSGGDEFTLVLEDVSDRHAVKATALRLLERLSLPYQVENRVFNLSASLGISIYPEDSFSIDALLNLADTAMYAAKKMGKNGYCFASGATGRLELPPPEDLPASPLQAGFEITAPLLQQPGDHV